MGSLSLLQRIFPTQESNQGLLHCRRILYHLSSQESYISIHIFNTHICVCTHILNIHTCTGTHIHVHTICLYICTHIAHMHAHTHTHKLASTCMRALSCLTVYNSVDCSPSGSSGHGIFLGKNTGVGCYFLLQGIFLTQGSNPGIPHCRWIPYSLIHLGSPICKHIHVYTHT